MKKEYWYYGNKFIRSLGYVLGFLLSLIIIIISLSFLNIANGIAEVILEELFFYLSLPIMILFAWLFNILFSKVAKFLNIVSKVELTNDEIIFSKKYYWSKKTRVIVSLSNINEITVGDENRNALDGAKISFTDVEGNISSEFFNKSFFESKEQYEDFVANLKHSLK